MKIGDMATKNDLDTLKNGEWIYKQSKPFKIVGEFQTYFICRYPRATPFLISKKKVYPV